MRIMGLDVGSRTVGVAVSDPMGWTAQGIEIIRINEDEGNFGYDRLAELVKEYEVSRFVVGLPKNMNNTIGERGMATEAFRDACRLPRRTSDDRSSRTNAGRTGEYIACQTKKSD